MKKHTIALIALMGAGLLATPSYAQNRGDDRGDQNRSSETRDDRRDNADRSRNNARDNNDNARRNDNRRGNDRRANNNRRNDGRYVSRNDRRNDRRNDGRYVSGRDGRTVVVVNNNRSSRSYRNNNRVRYVSRAPRGARLYYDRKACLHFYIGANNIRFYIR